MSVLPSFKSAFSSLAEAEDSTLARSVAHPLWSPLQPSSERRPATTSATPSTRPSVPPLPLDDLIGEPPAFGFARPEKHHRPPVDPLPLEVLGLAVDGLVYVRTQSKRATSPAVHAGAYKRPRTHSVSAGGSYVKVSSQPSSERLPQLPLSLASSPPPSAPSDTRPSLPRINNLKASNILSFAPPSITRSVASKPQVLSFHSTIPPGPPIIEDSTCRGPIDVLSSPVQRSLNSTATGRTANFRTAIGHTLTLSRGPTASDLSHLLGPRRNVHEGDVVDGTDALPRVVPKSQPLSREPTSLLSAQQPPQPPPPAQQHPPRQQTNPSSSLSAGDLPFRQTSNPIREGDKLAQVPYRSYPHQQSSPMPRSQRRCTGEDENRPEPWRQQPRPRPQPINGVVHLQPIPGSSRDPAPDCLRAGSSSHATGPYESPEPRYTSSRPSTLGHTENSNGGRWNHSLRIERSIGFPSGRQVPTCANAHEAFIPNGSSAVARQDGITRGMNDHGGQLNNLLGNDTRDDLGSVQCPHCPRKLRNQVTLQNHIRVVHDHSGNFRCPQCGLTFMWRSTLGNHVRLVHEKQRPYSCDQCPKAFRWKSHLREHFWVVHKGEKPFRCETCGKTFGRKNNMQKHMRKHTEGAS